MPQAPRPLQEYEIAQSGVFLRLDSNQGSDRTNVTRLLQNWDVARFLARPPWPFRDEDYLDCPQSFEAGQINMRWVIATADNGPAVGLISLSGSIEEIELGYFLDPQVHGQGIMTRAVKALCAFAFAQLGVQCIALTAFHDNPASAKVAEKCGFAFQGMVEIMSVPRGQVLVPATAYKLTRQSFLDQLR